MIDWSTLHDAYGPAAAIPGLLERAADRDQDAIDRLWGRLCHQGTISSASIAALPQLADIAESTVPGHWALDLAGAIAGGLLQDHHGADEEVARHEPTLARLRDLATARLAPARTVEPTSACCRRYSPSIANPCGSRLWTTSPTPSAQSPDRTATQP
ncbi:hypothetical protein [Kitasatospora indigofera]|uniref:hypothetical protein n=1 Tax=Kitasatospora indigofera TaxID=67307 RepID=UPI0033BB8806